MATNARSHKSRAGASAHSTSATRTRPVTTDRSVAVRPHHPAAATPILELQRLAGNQAVTALVTTGRSALADHSSAPRLPLTRVRSSSVVQRQTGTATDPRKAQWEADWNDPAFADAQKRFKGKGRPKGSAKHRYDVLCRLYAARGILRPLKFVTDEIVSATFFGRSTPAHADLRDKLAEAEKHYRMTHADTPIKRAWAFNARTTSRGSWSNHADGKAIDVDAPWNPHLTDARQRRVITGVTGMDIEAANPGADAGLDSFDASKLASDRFKAAYSEAGLQTAITFWTVTAPFHEAKREHLRKERQAIPAGRKASKADRAKRKALGQELIRLNRILGYTHKKKKVPGLAETLKDEFARYRKSQTAKSTAQLEVARLMGDIALMVPKLSSGTKAEKRRAGRSLKKLKRQLAKAEKNVKKAQTTLGTYGKEGFLNLSKDLVMSMKAVGLRWGGDWKTHKDFMHFDLK